VVAAVVGLLLPAVREVLAVAATRMVLGLRALLVLRTLAVAVAVVVALVVVAQRQGAMAVLG